MMVDCESTKAGSIPVRHPNGPFVYWLGHLVFTQAKGDRYSYGSPDWIFTMRKLLPFLLLLTGCFRYTWSESTPIENPPAPPVIIARGTDGINEWKCQLTELNSALAMVECDFRNNWPNIARNSTANSCIQVGFFGEKSGKLVVGSRKICSGPLKTGETSVNYAAFQKENRVALRKCGELLDLCVMLAGPDKL